ncbi:MAG TPA: DNA alkylation repair protein [Caulobacteraceae bacterium]|jgi:3-methyladenine DNA glycosylase AlkD
MTAPSPRDAAADLLVEIHALPSGYTKYVRDLRRGRSRAWKSMSADFIHGVALEARAWDRRRWLGYELIRFHKAAFAALDNERVARLAEGLDSWDSVDGLGRILTGAAWAQGLISDGLVEVWSRSPDRWMRRLALVTTIGLNMPADGGNIDARRTLAICARLAADRDDMVEKALSWALRVLATREPAAVVAFVADHEGVLAARVKREVRNKLSSGLKNPRRRA